MIKVFNHDNSRVRQAAAIALGKLGDKRATPALIKALNHEDSYNFERSEVARTLGDLGDKRATPAPDKSTQS